MEFRRTEDLKRATWELAAGLDRPIDLVAGVPRSGMLAATMLALHENIHLTDVWSLGDPSLPAAGKRLDEGIPEEPSVLVLDDSVFTGAQMDEVRAWLDRREIGGRLTFGAVYVTPDGRDSVDVFHSVVEPPRVFEWNAMHHAILARACVDLDGVLCRDPTEDENDDGVNYRAFVESVEPAVRSTVAIGWIVTCRLEKYRARTERWLDQHGIDYGSLVMMDHPDMATRRSAGDHAVYKAKVYERTGAELFIESSRSQADSICRRTGRPVLCWGDKVMLLPDRLSRAGRRGRELMRKSPVEVVGAVGRRLRRGLRNVTSWI